MEGEFRALRSREELFRPERQRLENAIRAYVSNRHIRLSVSSGSFRSVSSGEKHGGVGAGPGRKRFLRSVPERSAKRKRSCSTSGSRSGRYGELCARSGRLTCGLPQGGIDAVRQGTISVCCRKGLPIRKHSLPSGSGSWCRCGKRSGMPGGIFRNMRSTARLRLL